jgi:alkylated DNA repair protein (DNA oxidative demethylase)
MSLQLPLDLGAPERDTRPDEIVRLAPGAVLLRAFARSLGETLVRGVEEVARDAPFRHMLTPGGLRMSVAMTNCGTLGWVSDVRGYRYVSNDPGSDRSWPDMPAPFRRLARGAAAAAGFDDFDPDACLVNRYVPGARLTLHQDKDEKDFSAPIVSVSLGPPATFLLGGDTRKGTLSRVPLEHGDVVVFGGPARLRYHGVLPLADGEHALMGAQRINLTFRRAG